MSEMVERVARALMKVTALRPGAQVPIEFPILAQDPDFDDLPADHTEGTYEDEITQEAVLKLARAAIEAMRDMTDEMWRAGLNANEGSPDSAWEAMIDEALK